MPKSRHRKDHKKKSAARTKQMQEKRKYVNKLVADLEAEFAKVNELQATPQQVLPHNSIPYLTLTPTQTNPEL
jgi:hypothetical protein